MIDAELLKKYKNLKESDNIKSKWILENLRDGFQYFYETYGRYPISMETDSFKYLPSRKTIERSFGGMVKLRGILNLNTPLDFTKGETRSKVAGDAFKRAQNYEKDFFYKLISKIPEIRIHEHKIIRPGDTASDFFIYTSKDWGIMIDLFYAKDLHSLAGIIRIKSAKCLNVKYPIYFVLVDNKDIGQNKLDKLNENRKIKLQNNIKIVTYDFFINGILPGLKLEPINI